MAAPTAYMNGHVPGMQPSGSMTQMQNGNYTNTSLGGNGMAFSFRQRFERVDWRKLASADVDTISRTMDFNTLQENIMNVAFCNLDSEIDLRLIDPNFVKLFKLAQLTIEYLLHSQDYLSGMVQALEEKLRKAMEEHEETSRQFEKQKLELAETRKESHKRKKMLVAQQHIINNGSANNYNKCPYCTKAFVNHTFMQAHLMRRHSEAMSQMAASNASAQHQMSGAPFAGSSAMATPSSSVVNTTSPSNAEANAAIERELEELKERLLLTESQLTDERNARNKSLKQENVEIEKIKKENKRQLDLWKQKLQEQKKETERVQNMFLKELNEMEEKQKAAQQSLEVMQGNAARRSNLGAMQDDDEGGTNAELLRQQREEVAMLKEQLQHRLSTVEDSMQTKFAEQDKQWKQKMQAAAAKHEKEMQKLAEGLQKEKESQKAKKEKQNMEEETKVEIVEIVQEVKKPAQPPKTHTNLEVPGTQVENFDYEPSPEITPRTKTPEPTKKAKVPKETDLVLESDLDDTEDALTEMGSTMGTTMGTTMGHTTGTLTTLSGTWNNKSMRLLEQIKKDPNLLLAMKEELKDMLDQALDRRGIPKGTTGISNKVFHTQSKNIQVERQRVASKFPTFYEIRQQYITEVDSLAMQKYKEQKKTFSSSAPSALPHGKSPKMPRASTAPSGSLNLNGTGGSSAPNTPREQRSEKPNNVAGLPRPAPRPSSRDPNRTLGSTISGATLNQTGESMMTTGRGSAMSTGRSSGLSYTGTSFTTTGTSYTGTSLTGTLTETGRSFGTGTGTTWDSEEDDDDESETERDQVDGPTPQPRKPIKREPSNNTTTNDEDDSIWDDASLLDDMTPRPKTSDSPIGSLRPKGELVASLTKDIEYQLANRGKRPPGGKNTMDISEEESSARGSKKPPRRSTGEDSLEDEDDNFSISSLEEDSITGKGSSGARKTPTVRVSGGDTDTSMWGGSSKDSFPGNLGNQTQVSTGRTGMMNMSDFDSDSDLQLDDL